MQKLYRRRDQQGLGHRLESSGVVEERSVGGRVRLLLNGMNRELRSTSKSVWHPDVRSNGDIQRYFLAWPLARGEVH